MAFIYGMGADTDGSANMQGPFPVFVIAAVSVYLLLAAIFVVLNSFAWKTAIIIVAHILLLAYWLYLKNLGGFLSLPTTIAIYTAPIWILGFRLWSRPRKISAAVGDGVVAGR